MIPGTVSKLTERTVASAATIRANADIIKLTGAVTINTIIPGLGGGFSQTCILVPTTALTLGTSGNILVGLAAAVNRAVHLTYVRSMGKWIINSGV